MPQSFIADIVLKHSNAPLVPTLTTVPHASVTEVSVRPVTSADVLTVLYRVTDVNFHVFETEIAHDQTVSEWNQTMDFGDTRLYRIQLSPRIHHITPALSEFGIHVVNIESAGRGWRFQLETGKRDNFSALWDYCREEDIQFELEILRSSGAQSMNEKAGIKTELTNRQRQVARIATRMDYYKKGGASAKDVAAELDIAPSTLSTHLRRINAKIFDYLFAAESD